MLFNSWEFLIFFPIVVLVYFIIPKKVKTIWLLLVSYYFYMCWNAKYIVLILFSTLITWLSGLAMQWIDDKNINNTSRWKKIVVAFSFISNLGILAFFKYFNFLLSNINVVLRHTSGQQLVNPFDIILPVGISFFTFQALGYTVDVYRKTVKVEKSFINYALFVAFFPQLVAGPIERSGNLLKDIHSVGEKKMLDYERITSGLIIMLYGMFLKLVISDRVTLIVDAVYNDYSNFSAASLWLAAVGFSLQIYCDFAGYSTIAIGAARVMGFTLMENFNTPYFARSIKEFWRRWHISLSTWFKDYLYIPLGGNRCSTPRKYFNLMVTFLVSGVWHGAGWNYIAWGGLHGLYQIIGGLTTPIRSRVVKILNIDTTSHSHKLYQNVTTSFLVVIAWVFFRAPSFKDGLKYIYYMFGNNSKTTLTISTLTEMGFDGIEWTILFASLLVLFLVGLVKYNLHMNIDEYLSKQAIWFRWGVLFILLFAILIFGKYGPEYSQQAFIYFQF